MSSRRLIITNALDAVHYWQMQEQYLAFGGTKVPVPVIRGKIQQSLRVLRKLTRQKVTSNDAGVPVLPEWPR